MSSDTFYITTAIDYPNGKPHCGHAFEKIIADTYARWSRFQSIPTKFLTGTDENGQKLQISAEKLGFDNVQNFVDQNSQAFRDLCDRMDITYDYFIRTTQAEHITTAQKLWGKLKSNGDIYFDHYEGEYCYDCEAFHPESSQVEKGICPVHHKPLTFLKEEGYFFKTSKYSRWIEDHIRSNESFIFPKASRDEMLGRLKANPIRDTSISRLSKGWGVPVPGDEKHVMYTWFDAVINYFTPVDHGFFEGKYWPPDVHVIGKDITYFHTVLWPIMLHACGIDLPKQVHVHGMLVDADGKKMSKSIGNVVDPEELFKLFPKDSIRYYLLRHVSSGMDGRISLDMLAARNNAELANSLGNLVNRGVKLSLKRIGNEVGPQFEGKDFPMEIDLDALIRPKLIESMASSQHHKALDIIWEGVTELNTYLNDKEPWRIKDNPESFYKIMYQCLHGLRVIAHWLVPFLPEASKQIQDYLGVTGERTMQAGIQPQTYLLTDPKPLFARVDLEKEG